MNLGWLRGPARSMGLNLDAEVDFAFDGEAGHEFGSTTEKHRDLILQSTILHERTHWLHFIATTSGLFHMAVWEAQSLAAKAIIETFGDALDPHDFPLRYLADRRDLTKATPRVRELLQAWNGLQNLQAFFLGNSHSGLVETPTRNGFQLLSEFFKLWLIDRYPGPNAAEYAAQGRYDLPENFGKVEGLVEENASFLLGTYQLTEASARLSDFTVLQHGIEQLSPKLAMDVSHLRHGVYGVARNRFYRISGRELNAASEAILAVLLHEALNTPLPPVMPMSVFSAPWQAIGPYFRFSNFVKLTADYSPKINDPLDLEAFVRIRTEVRGLLLDRGLIEEDEKICDFVQGLFGGFADFRIPNDLYRIEGNLCFPVDYMRYRYLGRLFYNSFGLYRTAPGMIAWPGLYYVTERRRFRELFDPIRPPVLFIENEGYRPTYEDMEAYAVLRTDVYINEILRAAMTRDYPSFLSELRTFYHHKKHPSRTAQAFGVALLNAGFSEAFAARIGLDLAA